MSWRREVKEHQHGTVTGYVYGCRCDQCKSAHNEDEKQRLRKSPKYRHAAYLRIRKKKAERREYIAQIKMAIGCQDCGYRRHPDALEFDHLPGSVKKFNVGDLKLYSPTILHAEMDKCEIICANCHRIRTAERRSS